MTLIQLTFRATYQNGQQRRVTEVSDGSPGQERHARTRALDHAVDLGIGNGFGPVVDFEEVVNYGEGGY